MRSASVSAGFAPNCFGASVFAVVRTKVGGEGGARPGPIDGISIEVSSGRANDFCETPSTGPARVSIASFVLRDWPSPRVN